MNVRASNCTPLAAAASIREAGRVWVDRTNIVGMDILFFHGRLRRRCWLRSTDTFGDGPSSYFPQFFRCHPAKLVRFASRQYAIDLVFLFSIKRQYLPA